MNNGLTAENILSTLPPALSEDPRMQAIASGIADQLALSSEAEEALNIYGRVNDLPESLLDILASDLKVSWYDETLPIESKRKTILGAWYVHKHLGTVGAVKSGLKNVYEDAQIEEWFDYGGDPFHFRVTVDSGGNFAALDAAAAERALQFLEYYKNIRSHLDGIILQASRDIKVTYVGAGIYAATKHRGVVSTEDIQLPEGPDYEYLFFA